MEFGNYRPCVGIMVLNKAGLVFIGRRRGKVNQNAAKLEAGSSYEWQMPQGGIDDGEDPYHAALRELQEETNISTVTRLGEMSDWLSYDLPAEAARKSWKGRFKGQKQKWFAFSFEGSESEIDINNPLGSHRPEFDAWRWERMEQLPELIVPFKRAVYESVVAEFKHFSKRS